MKKRNIGRFSREHINRNRVTGPRRGTGSLPLSAAFFSVLFVVVSLSAGCDRTEPPLETVNQETRVDNRKEKPVWYRVTTLGFEKIKQPVNGDPEQRKPWTVQLFGSGLLAVDGNVYSAVNGVGIVEINDPFLPGGPGAFHTSSNPAIFVNRTIGSLFYYDSKVYCHVYSDRVFETPEPEDGPVTFVTLPVLDHNVRIVPVTFQESNNQWECVTLVPRSNTEWFCAWKKISADKTMFEFHRFNPETWREEQIEQKQFLRAIHPQDIGTGEERFRRFVTEVLSDYGIEEENVVDVSVRRPAPDYPETFRIGSRNSFENRNTRYYFLTCFVFRNMFYLLFPDGTLYIGPGRTSSAEAVWKKVFLPALPGNCVYTDIVTDGDTALVLWEEQYFTEIGTAGLLSFSGLQ